MFFLRCPFVLCGSGILFSFTVDPLPALLVSDSFPAICGQLAVNCSFIPLTIPLIVIH